MSEIRKETQIDSEAPGEEQPPQLGRFDIKDTGIFETLLESSETDFLLYEISEKLSQGMKMQACTTQFLDELNVNGEADFYNWLASGFYHKYPWAVGLITQLAEKKSFAEHRFVKNEMQYQLSVFLLPKQEVSELVISLKIEQTLLEQEVSNLLKSLSNSTGKIGYYEIDHVNSQIKYTAPWMKFFGLENADSMILNSFLSKIHPEDIDQVKKDMRGIVLREFTEVKNLFRLLFDNGEQRWILNFHKMVPSISRGSLKSVGIHIDISNEMYLQHELKREHDFLYSIINLNPNYIFVKDTERRYAIANTALADLLQTDMEALIGMKEEGFINDQSYLSKSESSDQRVLEGKEEDFQIEFHLPATGEKRYLHFIKKPVYSDFGKIIGLLGVATDVSENVILHNELKLTGKHYKDLFEHNGLGIITLNGKNQIVNANPTVIKMLGYTREEITHRNIIDLLHPQDFISNSKFLSNAKTYGYQQSLERRFITKNGAEVDFNVSVSCIYNEDDNDFNILMVVDDVSALKKDVYEYVTENKMKYDVFELIDAAVIHINQDGKLIEKVKIPYQLFNNISLNSLEEWLTQEESDYVKAFLKGNEFLIKFTTKLFGAEYEITCKRLNREEGFLLIKSLEDEQKAKDEYNEKISSALKKNKELEEYIGRHLQFETLTNIASHDLKEPIRTIGSFAEIFRKRYTPQMGTEANELMDYIIKSSKKLNEVVNGILSISKIETHAEKQVINAKPLLLAAQRQNEDLIQEKHAEIKINIGDNVLINVDKMKVEQLFYQLMNNAIKFNDKEIPKLTVTYVEGIKHHEFIFEDNGIGIDSEYKDTIFTLFKKLHTHSEYSGIGVGLSICKKIAEQHGGNISVESNMGIGSTFKIMLLK